MSPIKVNKNPAQVGNMFAQTFWKICAKTAQIADTQKIAILKLKKKEKPKIQNSFVSYTLNFSSTFFYDHTNF